MHKHANEAARGLLIIAHRKAKEVSRTQDAIIEVLELEGRDRDVAADYLSDAVWASRDTDEALKYYDQMIAKVVTSKLKGDK